VPKRIVDGEALWKSAKLARVPREFRPEYSWLVPLALGNGVFQCDPRLVRARCYSVNRAEVTLEIVKEILAALALAGLLFRWQEPDGTWWGCLTELRRPGLLPPPSRLKKRHYTCGPEPPPELLAQFEAAHAADGQPAVTQQPADGEKPNGHAVLAAGTPTKPPENSGDISPTVDDLMPLAEHLADLLGLPTSPKQLSAIIAAIHAKAAATGMSIEDAYGRLAGEAALAMQECRRLPFECSAQE
jgi:hypothetical protein